MILSPCDARASRLALAACLVAAAAGCDEGRSRVTRYDVPKEGAAAPTAAAPTPTPAAAAAPAAAEGSALAWDLPKGWVEQAAGGMRLGSFQVPVGAGAMADLSVIRLGGEGGGLVPNVNRWREQLGLAPEPPAAIEAAAVADTCALGAFKFFRLAPPEGDGMLAAVVPDGDGTLFVKLRAPLASLDELEPAFRAFCRSLRRS